MNYSDLLAQLGKMTAVGVLADDSPAMSNVIARIKSTDAMKKSSIHPVAIAQVLKVYESGQVSSKSKLKWVPNMAVMEALTHALHVAFEVHFIKLYIWYTHTFMSRVDPDVNAPLFPSLILPW